MTCHGHPGRGGIRKPYSTFIEDLCLDRDLSFADVVLATFLVALWASQCLLGKEHLEGFIHNDAQKWVVNKEHPTLKSSSSAFFELSTLKPKGLLVSPSLKCHLPKYRVNIAQLPKNHG